MSTPKRAPKRHNSVIFFNYIEHVRVLAYSTSRRSETAPNTALRRQPKRLPPRRPPNSRGKLRTGPPRGLQDGPRGPRDGSKEGAHQQTGDTNEWVLFRALGPKRPPGGLQAVAMISVAALAQVVRSVFLAPMQQRCAMMFLPHVTLPGAWSYGRTFSLAALM